MVAAAVVLGFLLRVPLALVGVLLVFLLVHQLLERMALVVVLVALMALVLVRAAMVLLFW